MWLMLSSLHKAFTTKSHTSYDLEWLNISGVIAPTDLRKAKISQNSTFELGLRVMQLTTKRSSVWNIILHYRLSILWSVPPCVDWPLISRCCRSDRRHIGRACWVGCCRVWWSPDERVIRPVTFVSAAVASCRWGRAFVVVRHPWRWSLGCRALSTVNE